MADLSKANMALEALEKMGVKPVGQSAATDDSADLEACYEELYEELQADGLVEWASDAVVPGRYVGVVSDIMAIYRAGKYDIPADTFNKIASRVGIDGEMGKNKIRRLMREGPVENDVYAGSYF